MDSSDLLSLFSSSGQSLNLHRQATKEVSRFPPALSGRSEQKVETAGLVDRPKQASVEKLKIKLTDFAKASQTLCTRHWVLFNNLHHLMSILKISSTMGTGLFEKPCVDNRGESSYQQLIQHAGAKKHEYGSDTNRSKRSLAGQFHPV